MNVSFFRRNPALTPEQQAERRHAFWSGARGVVHVGANQGAERFTYALSDLSVIFVEAIPDLADALQRNLKDFPKQTAIQAVLTDRDAEEIAFHVSSNGGLSSSVLEFAGHSEMWPSVKMVETLRLQSRRFDTLVREYDIDLSEYDSLVLDVQGAELLVLRGMSNTLNSFDRLIVEAADFEAYAGAGLASEIVEFCRDAGFAPREWQVIKHQDGIGTYYDIYFRRMSAPKEFWRH